ncbi:MAG: acetyltransferase [Lachnospiraceae bacterium]|nr:acetyltransferase [Lachnospiraceae bacterium]
MNRLIIIGASGHGKVVADIAVLCGYDQIEFLDDDESISSCGSWPVVGKCNRAMEIEDDMFVAIGNSNTRKSFIERYSEKHLVTLVHPNAVLSDDVRLGAGTVVMAGTVINPGTVIGKGCIINTSSSVDHDCQIEDYVHISVGAHLSGTVHVGEGTWIGAGATVSNNINICGGCTIGAGAVVIKNITESETYVGVPAKIIRD